MKTLARQYADVRRRYPDDKLLIVFDIDGTIVDTRYAVSHVLLEYDRTTGSDHFRGLLPEHVDVHEGRVGDLVARLPIAGEERREIETFFRNRCWQTDAILASHRPYRGVLDVIRWFQLQRRTHVALNTGRPEALRDQTLRSLNTLGRVCRVSFSSHLLFMNPAADGSCIAEEKAAALQRCRAMGYRVFAVVDNDPFNIETMARADRDGDILFLHADTIFAGERRRLPRAVGGRSYDAAPPAEKAGLPQRVQFVWRGVHRDGALAWFIESSLQWCEADVRTDPYGQLVLRRESYADRPWSAGENPVRFDRFVERIAFHRKSVKLDLEGGEKAMDRILGIICHHGIPASRLWFNGSIEDLDERGFRLIRTVFPDAIIQCPVDFLAPMIRTVPRRAREVLDMLSGWGVSRFSIGWKTEQKHRIFRILDDWGYELNLHDIPDLRAFLEAVLMLPCSLTAAFDDPSPTPVVERHPVSGKAPSVPEGTDRPDRASTWARLGA